MKKRKGFTLIELIIVVAIIGILAAIAVPKFGQVQKDAKKAADTANAKNIRDAVTILVAEGEILLPTSSSSDKELTINTTLDSDIASDTYKVQKALQSIPTKQSGGVFKVTIKSNGDIEVN